MIKELYAYNIGSRVEVCYSALTEIYPTAPIKEGIYSLFELSEDNTFKGFHWEKQKNMLPPKKGDFPFNLNGKLPGWSLPSRCGTGEPQTLRRAMDNVGATNAILRVYNVSQRAAVDGIWYAQQRRAYMLVTIL